MNLKNIIESSPFNFNTPRELRDFLNKFTDEEIDGLSFDLENHDDLKISYDTEQLSDGSFVNNLRIDGV